MTYSQSSLQLLGDIEVIFASAMFPYCFHR